MKYIKRCILLSKKEGFTLMELVVSMAIMAIIGAMVLSIVILSSKLMAKTTSETIIQDKYRISIMNMENDIRYSEESLVFEGGKSINEDSSSKVILYLKYDTRSVLYFEKNKKIYRGEISKVLEEDELKADKLDVDIENPREILDSIETYAVHNSAGDKNIGENKRINITFKIKGGKEIKEYSVSVLSKS